MRCGQCDGRAVWQVSVPSREWFACGLHLSHVAASAAIESGEARFALTGVDEHGALR